jgi:hypothetical protein
MTRSCPRCRQLERQLAAYRSGLAGYHQRRAEVVRRRNQAVAQIIASGFPARTLADWQRILQELGLVDLDLIFRSGRTPEDLALRSVDSLRPLILSARSLRDGYRRQKRASRRRPVA